MKDVMHDNFIVLDGETVETGCFNFSSSAESRNAENVAVLHDPGTESVPGRSPQTLPKDGATFLEELETRR